MTATIKFFPVGNGDMTLITTNSGKNILIDCNIRSGKECPDVVKQLRECLPRDSKNRLAYVQLSQDKTVQPPPVCLRLSGRRT